MVYRLTMALVSEGQEGNLGTDWKYKIEAKVFCSGLLSDVTVEVPTHTLESGSVISPYGAPEPVLLFEGECESELLLRLRLTATEVDEAADRLAPGAGIDRQHAGIGPGRALREDRVAEAAFVPPLLEESLGHAAAKRRGGDLCRVIGRVAVVEAPDFLANLVFARFGVPDDGLLAAGGVAEIEGVLVVCGDRRRLRLTKVEIAGVSLKFLLKRKLRLPPTMTSEVSSSALLPPVSSILAVTVT